MTGRTAGADLAAAITGLDPDRAADLIRSWGPVRKETLQDLLAVAGKAVNADLELTGVVLDVAELLAAQVGAEDVRPAASYLRARLALNQGSPEEALDLIDRSRQGWLDLGRSLDASRTELGRMHVLDDLGRHEQAAAAARSLRASLDALDRSALDQDQRGQVRWMHAAANENLGVATGFTGHHSEALEAYETAEQVYESVGDREGVARCRANRGVELVAVGRAVEGLDALLSAAEAFDEGSDRLSYAQCLGHVAEAEALLGRYAAALDRFRRADRLLEGLGALTEAIRLRLRTVRVYLALNLVDEASALAADAARALEVAGMEHDLAEAVWLHAVALVRADRPDEALTLLRKAAASADSVGDPALRARVLLTESEAFQALDQPERAQRAAEAALATVADGEWSIEELHARLRLVQLLHHGPAVDDHLQRAAELADELALPHLRHPVLVELARSHRNRGDAGAARRNLEEAIRIVEGLRGLIGDEMLRTSYLEGRTEAHVELLSMLLDGAPDELVAAFDLAESSKSRTLDDIMAGAVEAGPLPAGEVRDADLARHEADLSAAYNALGSGGAKRTRSQRQALQDRAVELEGLLRLTRLRTANTRESGPEPRHRSEIRRPGPDERVIEYHIVGRRVVAFVWSGGRLGVVETEADVESVSELIAAWERTRQRYELARGLGTATSPRLIDAATDVLRELWVALVSPIGSSLGETGDDELLIVPHGRLHVVPFHALPAPDRPLGTRWTVVTAPSYAVASLLRTRPWRPRWGRSLVVGVPDETAPAVASEAEEAAGALPGAELLIGCEGTVANVVTGTAEPIDVLHLACHGIHRPRNPMFSALKLSDRWLTAQDVMDLSLPGALVVLSACESGRSDPGRHREETIGLARSFVAAGAAAVVVSLWITADRVAADTMRYFYRALATAPPAAALRIARTAVAGDHPHPADWGPFIIHGGQRERP